MSIETVNEPIEGANPFLGMEIQEIAGNMEMVREQHKQAKSDWVRHALEQNIGWLQEALYVEIVWNQTHHE